MILNCKHALIRVLCYQTPSQCLWCYGPYYCLWYTECYFYVWRESERERRRKKLSLGLPHGWKVLSYSAASQGWISRKSPRHSNSGSGNLNHQAKWLDLYDIYMKNVCWTYRFCEKVKRLRWRVAPALCSYKVRTVSQSWTVLQWRHALDHFSATFFVFQLFF